MNNATVETIKAFEDFSGAPAVVSVGRYRFALDTLGEVKCNLIAPVSGSRKESKIAVSMARAAYLRARAKLVSDAWLAGNAALYA